MGSEEEIEKKSIIVEKKEKKAISFKLVKCEQEKVLNDYKNWLDSVVNVKELSMALEYQ